MHFVYLEQAGNIEQLWYVTQTVGRITGTLDPTEVNGSTVDTDDVCLDLNKSESNGDYNTPIFNVSCAFNNVLLSPPAAFGL